MTMKMGEVSFDGEIGVQNIVTDDFPKGEERQEIVEDYFNPLNQDTSTAQAQCEMRDGLHESEDQPHYREAKLKLHEARAKSEQEAYQAYCNYAHFIGFSVRKDHHTFWPNSRMIKSKVFVCSKSGFKRNVDSNTNLKYRKTDVRTGCSAMVRFLVDFEGNWNIQKLVESHNHELARSSDQHLLRSARVVSDEKAAVLKSMTEAGIRTVDAYDFLANEVGGVQNLSFSKRDAYNYIQRVRRSRIENGDTTSLIQLFKERQVQDNMFFYDYKTDDSNSLLNLFWVDGLGRIDYDCFGDVVIFDTSYRLNKYNLVCAPLVGVNHHWQNVLFGVAFLCEETIESFSWLFHTFLRIMDNKHPITIFTEQDQAMSRAIESTLPNTRHRLCQWHICKKAPSKVPCFNSDIAVRSQFYRCMSQCDSGIEFEQAWTKMITAGGLHDNTWLEDLYKIKTKWSTAFNKNTFDMGILSTQHNEFTNNICHGISKATSTLTDCFLGLEKVMNTWRQNEQDEDFKCSQSTIIPVSRSSSILKQAARFYSRKLYSFFEHEFLIGVGDLSIVQAPNDPNKFFVSRLDKKIPKDPCEVLFDRDADYLLCSCRKFETMGLLCYHCIRILIQVNAFRIPEKYLLPRWSVRAKNDMFVGQTFTTAATTKPTGIIFRNHISRFSYHIGTIAQGHQAAEQLMLSTLNELSDKIAYLVGHNQVGENNDAGGSIGRNVNDPKKCSPKGISNARLKGHWEKKKRVKVKKVDAAAVGQLSESVDQQVFPSMPHCFTPGFSSGDS